MSLAGSTSQFRPIAEINTTPLIDVMLVLLIMLVITIPIATNAVEVPLPAPGPAADNELKVNTVAVSEGGAILWNGRVVDSAGLVRNLAETTLRSPEPQLRFEPEPNAAYGRTAQVLWLIRQSGVTNFGFAGNERYRTFRSGS